MEGGRLVSPLTLLVRWYILIFCLGITVDGVLPPEFYLEGLMLSFIWSAVSILLTEQLLFEDNDKFALLRE
jgi:hypothetical protein